MMEKKHRCRLCFRNFGNGRSLGGHLRSHVLKFCAEEKSSRKSLHSYSSTSLPSSSTSSEEEEREIAYGLRENPVCRRSKQVRKSRISDFDVFMVKKSKFEDEGMGDINEQSPPSSSISGTTSEEHVAQLLMMLSSGKWEKEEGESEEEEEEELRGKYRCGACNKLFKSYQALGGHVASHKKTRASPPEKTAKIHRCPICGRIFSSGQALGGHKRSHFIGPNAIISRNSRIAQVLEIDLNLPAPIDDDESSQIVTSVFSTHVKQR